MSFMIHAVSETNANVVCSKMLKYYKNIERILLDLLSFSHKAAECILKADMGGLNGFSVALPWLLVDKIH